MSTLSTIAGFVVIGTVLAMGVKSERKFALEQDETLRPLIERGVRESLSGFNPQVSLTLPELRGFSLESVQITGSRLGTMLGSSLAGGDQSYDAYVGFRENGVRGCVMLDLAWKQKVSAWKVSHNGLTDRCEPSW